MTNSVKTNPIVLDTFDAAINLCTSLGFAVGTPLKLESIEWTGAITAGHTALITDAVSGNPIFSEKCPIANTSVIKYYHGFVDNLCIAISGVGSGSIIIHLA
ncbi:MAG: hypothetical protein IMZ64_01130 [Bacteroidetes bacterium]|nr:hypothetical protein [Bacteroidota bacterium]